MKITDLSVVFPIRACIDGGCDVLFVDLVSSKVFNVHGHEVTSEISEAVLEDLSQQTQTMAVTSHSDIVTEALNTKDEIMKGVNVGGDET